VALQDFEDVEAASQLMATSKDQGISIQGELLRFEFSFAPLAMGQSHAGSIHDWICPNCQATNFSRFVCPGRSPQEYNVYQGVSVLRFVALKVLWVSSCIHGCVGLGT
jgi:hypothetical protein